MGSEDHGVRTETRVGSLGKGGSSLGRNIGCLCRMGRREKGRYRFVIGWCLDSFSRSTWFADHGLVRDRGR
jgi:hypothetical protein